ncbi:TPA: hypothetical protein N0F65_011239 [Lagenidium giganteum]|uniref:Uncharacterized protein n=1 Tax=Lagenidium giganteum TaxID=4803 RepID=A0AAV2Z2N5_9STRA|nr:TPA: hypothetical protein N0F65_011239 [Lagenidium giganteum]
METPPRDWRGSSALPPKQLHARLKMQMEREMDVEDGVPELERMDEMPVHTDVVKAIADDFDDEDLD